VCAACENTVQYCCECVVVPECISHDFNMPQSIEESYTNTPVCARQDLGSLIGSLADCGVLNGNYNDVDFTSRHCILTVNLHFADFCQATRNPHITYEAFAADAALLLHNYAAVIMHRLSLLLPRRQHPNTLLHALERPKASRE
jgi:hypothetical protein